MSEGESGVPLLEKPQSVEVCNQESNCSDVSPLKAINIEVQEIEWNDDNTMCCKNQLRD